MRRWGRRAAGVLPIAQDTGRLLLLLRSPYVREPLTWGLAGGAMESNESPVDTALREFVEETRYAGPIQLAPLGLYREPHFEYHSYIGLVPSEFETMLDWENVDSGWFELGNLPAPLHPGAFDLFEHRWNAIVAAVEAT